MALTALTCGPGAVSASAQSTVAGLPSLSPDRLREDLTQIAHALGRAHPGLDTYMTRVEFQALVREHEAQIDRPLDAYQFSRIVTHLVASLHDGHSSIILPDDLQERVSQRISRFPFTVRVAHRRPYIVCNQSDDLSIRDGSEILSINAVPAGQVLETMKGYVMVDGFNDAGFYHALGLEHYTPFGRVFPYVFGYPDRFIVEYREHGSGEIRTTIVEAVSPMQVGSRMWERYAGEVPGVPVDSRRYGFPPEIPLVTHRVIGSIGILRIARLVHGSYAEPDSVYAQFYARAFHDFRERGVETVIIDIRDNGGGTAANGALLLRHLVSGPFTPTRRIWGMVASIEEFHGDNEQYASSVVRDDDGRYVVRNHDWLRDLKTYQPSEGGHFGGRLYVLIDGGTRSAAATLAGLLRQHTRAVFVGDETSGNAGVTNGVVLLSVTGRHSGVGVRFPALHAEADMPEGLRKRGVVPDLYFTPSIEDVLDGRDSLLEYALQVATTRP